jgi:hypothetical protein
MVQRYCSGLVYIPVPEPNRDRDEQIRELYQQVLPGMRKRGKTVKSAMGQPGAGGGMRRYRSLRHEAWPVAWRGGDEMEPG